MNRPTKEELKRWSDDSDKLLLVTELQDAIYRKKICSKCTKEMRKKRSCEDMGNSRTFCEHLVRARNRNKKLQEMYILHSLNSPFIKGTFTRKVAEKIYLQQAKKVGIGIVEKVSK